jgi:hypothetical protein
MDKVQPEFLIYAKRKNSREPTAHIYLRICYREETAEQSTDTSCLFNQWQTPKHIVRDNLEADRKA